MAAQLPHILLILAAGILTLYLPGAAWQAWFPRPDQDPAARLADALGLSLAFTALAALAGFVFGVHFSSAGLVSIYAGLAALLAAGWIRGRHSWKFNPGLLLVLFGLGLVIGWRLYQARSLLLPAWVNSVHHVLIVRVMLEKGGLPADLSPYLAIPFFYHYAFHAAAAVFAFWARLSPDQAVLILGQVLNAAVCLSVYRLSKTLWKDVRRAAAAALLVAFAFHMPAYYLTWGRYTLLTGLVLLPLAMAAAVEISRSETPRTEAMLRLGLLTGGLFLAHYLAAILLAFFLILLGLRQLWVDIRRRSLDRAAWAGLLAGTGIGVGLALPWLARIYQYSAYQLQVSAVLGADAPDQVYFSGYLNYLWYLAGPYRNHALLAMAVVAILFALRSGPGRLAAAWGVALAVFSWPWGLRLGPFRPDHMVIVLFLPAALLLGDLLVSAGEAAGIVLRRRWEWVLAGVAVFSLCLWGVLETRNILNPSTVLADQDDLAAARWVGESTSPDARFFINAAYWQGNVYRGVDGGWWLLPLTGRETVVPPVLFTWGESGAVQQAMDWSKRSSTVTKCGEEFWSLVRDARLDYAYLHTGEGGLQPRDLAPCPGVEPVHQEGKVWIFKLTPPAAN